MRLYLFLFFFYAISYNLFLNYPLINFLVFQVVQVNPNHPSFYKLTDYYGLYVWDEANVEVHGMKPMGRIAHDPGWRATFLSVLSCSNEIILRLFANINAEKSQFTFTIFLISSMASGAILLI